MYPLETTGIPNSVSGTLSVARKLENASPPWSAMCSILRSYVSPNVRSNIRSDSSSPVQGFRRVAWRNLRTASFSARFLWLSQSRFAALYLSLSDFSMSFCFLLMRYSARRHRVATRPLTVSRFVFGSAENSSM